MRLADDELGELGMAEEVAGLFRDALSGRDGLILVAGPAGSGRAATLAAGLDINPAALVLGEIGDGAEAAKAALRVAAGRLVLAPIQAAGAVAAISRLRELRADPFTIAATLRAVIAQRGARRLCAHCRAPVQASGNVAALLGFDPGTFVYAPRGCAACAGSGYQGRIGLYEALPIEGAIRRLVGMDGDAAVIASHAFRDRPDLSGAARAMVRQGLIAADDAVRLSRTAVLEPA